MFQSELPKHPGTPARELSDSWLGIFVGPSAVCGGRNRSRSRLCARRRRLLQAVAISVLMLPEATWGQVTETLPEVTVTAPRPAPVRRTAPAAAPARPAPSRRVSAPAPSRPSAGTRAANSRVQAVAPTPVTGLIDRDKVPAMVQTLRRGLLA
jgi:hypothetical protein